MALWVVVLMIFMFCWPTVRYYGMLQIALDPLWLTHPLSDPSEGGSIDPFHARHSIAVTVVMYHMTWRSSKKTESWIQAKCIAARKMNWQLSRRLPQVSIAAFTEDFRIAEWLRSLTSNSAE